MAQASAGAWTLAPGETKIIVTTTLSKADEEFGPDGTLVSLSEFRKVETSLFVEFGIADEITLIGAAAYRNERITDVGVSRSQSGPTHLDLGARVRLGKIDDTIISLQSLISRHTASEGEDPFGSQSGDLDYEIGLITGQPFDLFGLKGFTDSETAYRYRPGGRADEVKVNVTLGFQPDDTWMVLVQSFNFTSIGPEALIGKRTRSHKLKLSLVRRVHENLSVELGAFKTIAGENIVEETAGLLAFWYNF